MRPTVLYFYGNAECMATADFVADRFGAMGCNVMLVDYAGFGMSGGKPSEEGCYEAAEAAYQYVITRRDVDKTKLVAAGWSLGGAVAIDLAWRHRGEGTICGLMTFSSFTSMVDLAQHLYPVLPVGLVLKHRFMSVEKLREVKVPYFCGHGRGDSIVPFGFSGRLCAAAGCGAGGVTKYESGSDHNDFFDVEEERLNGAVGEFLGRVTGE